MGRCRRGFGFDLCLPRRRRAHLRVQEEPPSALFLIRRSLGARRLILIARVNKTLNVLRFLCAKLAFGYAY